MMTTFIFRVRNVPAALYKAMGGFATNGINMTKLESYQLGGILRDAVLRRHRGPSGRPQVELALEELASSRARSASWASIPAHPFPGHAR